MTWRRGEEQDEDEAERVRKEKWKIRGTVNRIDILIVVVKVR